MLLNKLGPYIQLYLHCFILTLGAISYLQPA